MGAADSCTAPRGRARSPPRPCKACLGLLLRATLSGAVKEINHQPQGQPTLGHDLVLGHGRGPRHPAPFELCAGVLTTLAPQEPKRGPHGVPDGLVSKAGSCERDLSLWPNTNKQPRVRSDSYRARTERCSLGCWFAVQNVF